MPHLARSSPVRFETLPSNKLDKRTSSGELGQRGQRLTINPFMTLTHSLPLCASDIISAGVPKAWLTDGSRRQCCVLTHKPPTVCVCVFVGAFKSTRKPNEPRRKFLLAALRVVTTTAAASPLDIPPLALRLISLSMAPFIWRTLMMMMMTVARMTTAAARLPHPDNAASVDGGGEGGDGGGGGARTRARRAVRDALTPRQSDFTAFRQDDA